jgi:glutaredoxin
MRPFGSALADGAAFLSLIAIRRLCMRIYAAVVVVILLIAVGVCRAEVYKYTDGKGELHFVDDISKVPKKYRKQVENVELQGNMNVVDAVPSSVSPRGRAAQEPTQQQNRSANVEVFMTSWCGYCKKMVRFLNEKGISYTAYDIEKDSAAATTYRELGGKGVPVVRVGSHVVHGYSPEAVMSYYNGGK